ncbi:hypothetical protein BgiBS90_010911 [Biomphalaria glabrata]|nr:hypothetical protein BgiBS90_010911 [Biomphalaria glabrata]
MFQPRCLVLKTKVYVARQTGSHMFQLRCLLLKTKVYVARQTDSHMFQPRCLVLKTKVYVARQTGSHMFQPRCLVLKTKVYVARQTDSHMFQPRCLVLKTKVYVARQTDSHMFQPRCLVLKTKVYASTQKSPPGSIPVDCELKLSIRPVRLLGHRYLAESCTFEEDVSLRTECVKEDVSYSELSVSSSVSSSIVLVIDMFLYSSIFPDSACLLFNDHVFPT